ncbi:MAG: hypothetical protein IJL71_06700 [Oscillospiraceae bacterium]|nr:hypothetical protein [Oscillospiraceae bacterium]
MKSIFKVSSIIAVLLIGCVITALLSGCVSGNTASATAEPPVQTSNRDTETANDYDYDVLGNTDYVFVGKIVRNDVLNYDPFVPVEELPKDENGDPILTGHYVYCTVQVVKNVKGSLATGTDIPLESTAWRDLMTKDTLPVVGEDYIFCAYAYMDGTLSLPDESINIPYSEEVLSKIDYALNQPKDNPRPLLLSRYDSDVLSKFTEESEIAEYVYNENHYNYFMMYCDYAFVGKVNGINGVETTSHQSGNGETDYHTAVNYDVEVIKNIKGSLVTDKDIELLQHCGINDSGEPVFSEYPEIKPEVGETYIFYTRTEEDIGWDVTIRPLPESVLPYSDEVVSELERINESLGEYVMRHPMSVYDTAYEPSDGE